MLLLDISASPDDRGQRNTCWLVIASSLNRPGGLNCCTTTSARALTVASKKSGWFVSKNYKLIDATMGPQWKQLGSIRDGRTEQPHWSQ